MSKIKLGTSHAETIALAFSAGRSSAFDEATDAMIAVKDTILATIPESPDDLKAHLATATKDTVRYIEGFLSLSDDLRVIYKAMIKEFNSEQEGQQALIFQTHPYLKGHKVGLQIEIHPDDNGNATMEMHLVLPDNEDDATMMPSSTDAVH